MKEILGKEKKFILITFLLVIIGGITSMITPIMIQYFNDQNVSLSFDIMLYIFLAMLVSYLLQIFMFVYRENFAASFNVNYLFSLIKKVYDLKYDKLIEKESSYLVNRIFTAVDSLYLFLVTSLSIVIKAGFIICLSLLVLFFISWKIFMVLLLLLPLNFFGFKYINKHLALKMEKMQKDSASANKDLIVTLSNSDNVKSQASRSAMEHLLKPQITAMYQSLANTNKYAQITSNTITFINQLVQNMTYIWTSILIVNQEFPVGNLIIISIIIPMYYSALGDLSKANIDYKSLLTANDFIKNELDANREARGDFPLTTIDHVTIDHPSFYLGEKKFSYDLNVVLEKGDIIYLEGDSGSGKSSLLRLLLNFRSSTGIRVNDLPINEINNHDLRNRIAYISQTPTILSTSLEQNIGMGKKLSDADKKSIQRSGILGAILKDKNWQSILYENGGNLSGGEKQRIAISRLMISDADMYILDESISNIDKESAVAIMDFLLKNKKEKIILFTTHDKFFKRYANKRINISSGGTK